MAIAAKHDVMVGNVAHAGDGNLHPLFMFDPADTAEAARVHSAGAEIMARCVELGGTLSGEHGIGIEKRGSMPLRFTPVELELMYNLKLGFDPDDRLNPGKILPPRQSELKRPA